MPVRKASLRQLTPTLLAAAVAISMLVACSEDSQPPVDIAATSPAPTAVPTRTPEQLPTAPPTGVPLSATSTPVPTPSFRFSLIVSSAPAGLPKYHRDSWRHWTDEDGDCQNTRAEVLIDESSTPVGFDGCRVISGQWLAPFTETSVTDASLLDVDHMVPLANAHRSGGWAWDAAKKRAYANYLMDADHLVAVTRSANRSKGARGPEEWRPPAQSYWCAYATDWARIKDTWSLSVTRPELVALRDMLSRCNGDPAHITEIDDPGLASGSAPTPTPTPPVGRLRYDPFGPDRDCGDFDTWPDAQSFYLAAGGPLSDRHRLDGDRNGAACERLPGAP